MQSRHLLAALLPLLLGCAATQAAQLVDVQIVDRDTGTTLPLYSNRAKQYVAGAPGHRYAVRIVNRTGARVMTVLSVDGVNAITGQTASPDQSGYVLGAYESTEVAGWRKDMSEIAAFEFTALSDSYAARTGRPSNVGVIGVAVYRERPVPPPTYREPQQTMGRAEAGTAAAEAPVTAAPAPPAATANSAAGAAPRDAMKRADKSLAEESLGTGHGAREDSRASYVSFERATTQPTEVVSIWYDSVANLQARGIIARPRPVPTEPQAFPTGFVADPPPQH
ncbi:MAG: hypothetical protein ABI411_06585 [Tahibacter sp.]